ncbi:MAG: antA/AntB antirepressor family protein [Phycisphaerae bacterium]|nr:antA/AntB antirepressor family protein [Phycisphaerae bacterium]
MNEIIKINTKLIGAEEVNSVNARDIHNYLVVKTPFSMWIQRAIKKYDFMEDEDFTIHKIVSGKNVLNEYIVTMDMAAELSMLENNKKGKETRKYFIKMEKETLNQVPHANNNLTQVLVELIKGQQKQTDMIIEILKQKQEVPVAIAQNIYIDGRSRRKIHEEIKQKAKEQAEDLGISKDTIAPAIWIALKQFFDVDDYQDLQQSQLKDVLHFIMFWEAKKPVFKSSAKEYPFGGDAVNISEVIFL